MYKTIKPGLVVSPCTCLYISNHDEGIRIIENLEEENAKLRVELSGLKNYRGE